MQNMLGTQCFLLLIFIVPSNTVSLKHISVGAAEQKRTILLMQGDREGHRLRYMYEPVMTTLRLGFNNSKYNLKVVTPPVNRKFVETSIEYMAKLKRGDMMVWLGTRGKKSFIYYSHPRTHGHARSLLAPNNSLFDFGSIRSRGVKLVYYQTEPTEKCEVSKLEVDEMWDFSWHNINHCKNDTDAPVLRYVPLAAYSTLETRQKHDPGPLLFLGGASKRPCWDPLKSAMGDRLIAEYSTWNDDAYRKLLDGHNIFLNLQKLCLPLGPVTFRNAKLLNAHGLIISQRIDPNDEKEFDGLIDFLHIKHIPERYFELAKMNATARQKLADERTAIFWKRFHPHHIFERAGIYNSMLSS